MEEFVDLDETEDRPQLSESEFSQMLQSYFAYAENDINTSSVKFLERIKESILDRVLDYQVWLQAHQADGMDISLLSQLETHLVKYKAMLQFINERISSLHNQYITLMNKVLSLRDDILNDPKNKDYGSWDK